MKSIIYGRAHRNDIRLSAQMEKLRNYCLDKGYEVESEVIDCCSGSQVGDNLIRLIRQPMKEYDMIVVQDPSRISREVVKIVETVKMIRSSGIWLLFTETEDLNAQDEKTLEFKNFLRNF